jgi:uncharacterized membrane protein YccF (DUF307 family)
VSVVIADLLLSGGPGRSADRAGAADPGPGAPAAEPGGAAVRGLCVDTLRTLLNLVWLVLHGWLLALAYALAGVLACLLVVTIPFGIAAFRLAGFVVWPFGRTTVRAPGAGVASALGNLVWFLVAGWWLALVHVVAGIAFCVTIVGIPFGIASFKLAAVGLFPLGKRVVETAPPRDWMHAGSGVVQGAPARW